MPLEKGKSKSTISHNIEEMQKAGHSHAQSVAAALHTAHPEASKHIHETMGTHHKAPHKEGSKYEEKHESKKEAKMEGDKSNDGNSPMMGNENA